MPSTYVTPGLVGPVVVQLAKFFKAYTTRVSSAKKMGLVKSIEILVCSGMLPGGKMVKALLYQNIPSPFIAYHQ